MNEPQPVRKLLRLAIRKLELGSAEFRYRIGAVERPSYAYLVYQAAQLAHRLGQKRVSVLEFGVAGGAGLLCLERHAEWVEKIFPVKIEIYGFDTGEGLPSPIDYRDLTYHWKSGFFKMDQAALKSRIRRSTLVLGNVRETVKTFIEQHSPAPIGAMSHDFDFYSSTRDSFQLFEAPDAFLLPRVFCYFDDVIGGEVELYGDHTGERAAILDFNAEHQDRKLSPAYYLAARGGEIWQQQIWTFHAFSHPDYGRFVSDENQQLPI